MVYDHELGHIWPPEAALREKQIQLIERFAAQNGLTVAIRDIGINAIFKKQPGRDEQVKPELKTLPNFKSRMQVSAQQDSRKITSFRRPDFNAHV